MTFRAEIPPRNIVLCVSRPRARYLPRRLGSLSRGPEVLRRRYRAADPRHSAEIVEPGEERRGTMVFFPKYRNLVITVGFPRFSANGRACHFCS